VTAVQERPVKTPPRIVIRTFWLLHRAAYRITGGRFGLSRPEAGARFGMLWLTTTGRRSGNERRTMVGYYEDGPNLVTLAMNGWGDTDPAWWLNLQSQPDATVELPDGRREVRARAAEGAERDRLWAKFQDYDGWGEDLEGLVGRRARPTAIVVFEPRHKKQGAGGTDAGRMSAENESRSSATRHAPRDPARTAQVNDGRRLRRRHLWVVPGLSIAVYASGQAQQHELGLVPLLLFGILPHLPSLVGMGDPRPRGHISPRAVPLFNAMHHVGPPVALIALAVVGVLSPFWMVSGLAWLSHIVIDGAIEAGTRAPDGSARSPFAGLVDVARR
jgi:deazaflavin-dependent oxidoreductase (nitroreductase family)